jgi:protein SCO1/2
VAFALVAVACASDVPATRGYTGVVRDIPLDVADQHLTDVTEASFRADGVVEDGKLTLRAAPDRILLVYFGFTNCPDVCPTTLADLRVGLRDLDPTVRDAVDLAFVTVDPERDTATVLNNYTKHFFDRFHVLRGTEAEVRTVADAFLASFTVDKSTGRTEVTHTAVLYAVDAAGAVRVEWPFGTPGPAMGDDLAMLYRELYGA